MSHGRNVYALLSVQPAVTQVIQRCLVLAAHKLYNFSSTAFEMLKY